MTQYQKQTLRLAQLVKGLRVSAVKLEGEARDCQNEKSKAHLKGQAYGMRESARPMKMKNLKQTAPFKVVIAKKFKDALRTDAERFGKHYGIFFDSSGMVRVEEINPNAQYEYLFRTDKQ